LLQPTDSNFPSQVYSVSLYRIILKLKLAQKFSKRNSDIHYSTDQQRKTKKYLAKGRNYGEFENALNGAKRPAQL
jgi:hypothetical protein